MSLFVLSRARLCLTLPWCCVLGVTGRAWVCAAGAGAGAGAGCACALLCRHVLGDCCANLELKKSDASRPLFFPPPPSRRAPASPVPWHSVPAAMIGVGRGGVQYDAIRTPRYCARVHRQHQNESPVTQRAKHIQPFARTSTTHVRLWLNTPHT